MANFNKVILIGNLTHDPEVRYTPSGMAVTDLDMAINRHYKGKDGQMQEETCYVNRITVWGRQAESCGKYLRRGMPVLVEGRLRYDTWEKDGQKHSRLGVVAERVQFLSGPNRGSEFQDSPATQSAQQPVAQPAQQQSAPAAVSEPSPMPPPVQPEAPAGDDNALKDDEDNLPF